MILVLGDTHVDLNNVKLWLEYCVNHGIKTIFQVGDFGHYPNIPDLAFFIKAVSDYATELGVTIYFVHGNHDNIQDLTYNYGGGLTVEEIAPSIFWTPTGVPFELEGVRMMAVGGAWSIDGWKNIPNVDYFPEETLTYADVHKACSTSRIEVLFCHDCPSSVDLNIDMHDEASNNRENLQVIVDEVCPKILFHGHYHFRHDTVIYNKRKARIEVHGLAGNKELPCDQAVIFYPEDMKVVSYEEFNRSWRLNNG